MLILAGACSSPVAQLSLDGAVTGPTDGGGSDAAQQSDAGGMAEAIDGRILFRGLGEGVYFNVVLNRAAVAAPTAITRGDGHCDVHPVGAGDSFVGIFPPGDLDLGATVTAINGSTTLAAKVDTSGGGFQYLYTQAGVDAFGKTWTLANSGSKTGLAATTLVTVQVPARVVPIVPAPEGGSVDTTSGHVTLKWTGGEGAQTFHVYIQTSKAEVDCYPAPTATSFELPAEVVKVLDPQVTPALWAESVTVAHTGNRRLWVRVTSDNLD
jgi:hypothetical protein